MPQYNKLSLFFLSYFLLWQPVQVYILEFDAAGRFTFLMMVLAFLLIGDNVLYWFRRSKLLKLYLILCIYILVNGFLKHSPFNFWEFQRLFYSIITMILAMTAYTKNDRNTLKCIAYVMTLSVLMFLLFDTNSKVHTERFGDDFNAVDIGLRSGFSLLVSLLYLDRNKREHLPVKVVMVLAPLLLVYLSGSRAAFGISVFFLIAFICGSEKTSAKSYILMILGLLCIGAVIYVVISGSVLGDRLLSTSTQTEGKSYETGTFLDKLGDRGAQYYFAFPYIKDNLLTGIGFQNWRTTGPFGIVFHSEYLVQLCECGLLAFIPFLVFFITILVRGLKLRPGGRVTHRQSALIKAFVLSMIIINGVMWTNDRTDVFCIYGLLLAMYDINRGKVIPANSETTDPIQQ